MEVVNSEKKWQKVANDMGYSSQNKNIGPLLKAHYERIIYPLDIFEREEQRKNEAIKKEVTLLTFLDNISVLNKSYVSLFCSGILNVLFLLYRKKKNKRLKKLKENTSLTIYLVGWG